MNADKSPHDRLKKQLEETFPGLRLPTLRQLHEDPGLIGQALRTCFGVKGLGLQVIEEADRWAETENPWQFLANLPCMQDKTCHPQNKPYRDLFESAATQRTAQDNLFHKAIAIFDTGEESKAALRRRDFKTAKRLADHTLRAYLKYRVIRQRFKGKNANREDAAFLESRERIAREEKDYDFVRQLNRVLKQPPLPGVPWHYVHQQFPVEFALVWGWLQGPKGIPGFVFFTDAALHECFTYAFPNRRLSGAALTSMRFRLGLRKLSNHHLLISQVSEGSKADGRLYFRDRNDDVVATATLP